MPKDEEKKSKEEVRYNVVQVPTQTTPMIEDTTEEKPEDRYITTEQALVLILNKLDNMQKKIVG